ncbi:ABC transporter permease [Hyphomicrobiales bacterium]|jgi:putative spermidine/putrescine transport system permease protein|uniref:ABC transporter permease n=1 Tax=unclassified Chelatococcus TaxID=2638111 RepID=UPI001BD04519|nr:MULTISPECIES: ABC transporter permease subunit [unclassified Chelatococcus]CAH1662391.1 ABC transporter permease [Hyphomicrobiales bacterium]MBS7738506.1 ABC transporter permease subunit [Chelatococcus sp. HY11]MBX3542910.1 ABC transporter permease subunit [Chelatococcus sp.]MCO5076964.1 ABC transporter permease subunit [Chelatococcus sp.]CAH1663469.1 ABC transporter permease subunit [Hyphomicrobiales bacterium]
MTATTTMSSGKVRWPLPTGLGIAASCAFIFVVAPLIVVAGAALNAEAMFFPPRQLTLHWMIAALTEGSFVNGALISFVVAAVAATVSTLFALPVALQLRKAPPAVARILTLSFMGPLLVPSVIFALALYSVMMYAFGVTNLFILMIGHVIITMPYPVRTITAVTEHLDPALEDAASSVGASPWRTFVSVTLPLIKPGVIAGFLFAFITSWNDFSISVFLTPRELQPLPIKIYEYLLFQYRPIIAAVSTWSVIGSAIIVLIIDRLVGLNVFTGRRA